MEMSRDDFRKLSLAHARGTLGKEDALRFEKALADADEKMLMVFAEAASQALGPSTSSRPMPSPALKSRLMADIRGEAGTETSPGTAGKRPHPAARPRFSPDGTGRGRTPTFLQRLLGMDSGRSGPMVGMALATLALCLGSLVYAFMLKGSLGHREASLLESRRLITALEDSLARREAMMDVLLSHNLQVVVMRGQKNGPEGYGKMIWCPKRRCGILHVANLPPVPEDRSYQLWIVPENGDPPQTAGTFDVRKYSRDGDLFRIRGMAEVERKRIKGFLITLEPDDGSPAPTGSAFLQGSTLL